MLGRNAGYFEDKKNKYRVCQSYLPGRYGAGIFINRINKITNKSYDEIIETHRLTGPNNDYMLKIVATSIEAYDNFQQKLIGELEFTKMSSSISLQEMKNSHILPLNQFQN